MDKRIGYQFTNRGFREHPYSPTQSLFNDLIRGHKCHDVVDNSLEASSISFGDFLLTQSLRAANALVLDDPNGFALESWEVAEFLSEQDGTQVCDVPTTRLAGNNQAVVLERVKDRRTTIRKWYVKQVKVGRVIELEQNFFGPYSLVSYPILKIHLVKDTPECPFFFRVVLKSPSRASYTDELITIKSYRLMRRGGDLQQHDALPIDCDFIEAKINTRVQPLQ